MLEDFKNLQEEVAQCTLCELSQERTNAVFGEGQLESRILIIGEAPGKNEDLKARPFVGRSGQLLDQYLEKFNLSRNKNVFITNIVKCRPPNNRNPRIKERNTCKAYLFRQIELLKPEVIVLLGATALNGLVDSKAKIGQSRGQWLLWKDKYWTMPIYHPAALLRNPKLKASYLEDFQKILDKLEEEKKKDKA